MTARYLLGYDTALQIYRRAGKRFKKLHSTTMSLDSFSKSQAAFAQDPIFLWLESQNPIHIIVSSQNDVRHSSKLVTHVWGTHQDSWPVIKLTDTVYVCSPEFLFLQMATILDELELIFLGYELCGIYEFPEGRIVERQPMTSIDVMRHFIVSCNGSRGRKKALQVIKFILDRSGSPMETELVLRLCLPRTRGGRGIAMPEMNTSLSLPPLAQQIVGYPHITPDVYWRSARLVYEYDSDEEHVGADRIAQDARRRLAYETMHLQAVTVTNDMLQSYDGFESLVKTVAQATGRRLHHASADELKRRRYLHKRLHYIATHPESLTWQAHKL